MENARLTIRQISINWNKIPNDSYLHTIPAIRNTTSLSFHAPVTFFTGENGSGKSTLLEAIAIAYGFNPEGGSRNYRFSTYDSHSELGTALTLVRSASRSDWGYFFRAESFYNVASMEEEYSQTANVQAHYHQRSHGESFLKMAQLNMQRRGFYLLDEPEAALSPQRQLTLLSEIHDSVRLGSQFIIATHSPVILGFPDAEILSFDESAPHPIRYEETESVKITRPFLDHRQQILHALFEE
ncbi:MAG: AAA family ATPase, partial [Clostridia bacterium]|nr:AAA family ATPase [Clostridia bacterium]